jgi:hypothetical protein
MLNQNSMDSAGRSKPVGNWNEFFLVSQHSVETGVEGYPHTLECFTPDLGDSRAGRKPEMPIAIRQRTVGITPGDLASMKLQSSFKTSTIGAPWESILGMWFSDVDRCERA